MPEETNAESLRKSITILLAFTTLALGIAGTFLSWRDSVHARIGDLSESISVIKTENIQKDRAIATLLSQLDRLNAKLEITGDNLVKVSERLIRCEKDNRPNNP
jgi:hypothetical protein